MRAATFFVLLAACDRVYGLTGRAEPNDADATDASDLERGLVAWYPMDTVSDRVEDASGNSLDGLCDRGECPTSVDGTIDGALSFDGTMMVGVNSHPRLETTEGFTVSGWFRLHDNPTGFECPFNKVGNGGDNTWQLCITPALVVRFISTGSMHDDQLDAGRVDVGAYYHVVLWWDGAEKRIYVNGLNTGSIESPVEFTGGIVTIGADRDGGDVLAYFDGDIDDLRIYNRALGIVELDELYNLGNRL